jgi:hypothetical protein
MLVLIFGYLATFWDAYTFAHIIFEMRKESKKFWRDHLLTPWQSDPNEEEDQQPIALGATQDSHLAQATIPFQ